MDWGVVYDYFILSVACGMLVLFGYVAIRVDGLEKKMDSSEMYKLSEVITHGSGGSRIVGLAIDGRYIIVDTEGMRFADMVETCQHEAAHIAFNTIHSWECRNTSFASTK